MEHPLDTVAILIGNLHTAKGEEGARQAEADLVEDLRLEGRGSGGNTIAVFGIRQETDNPGLMTGRTNRLYIRAGATAVLL